MNSKLRSEKHNCPNCTQLLKLFINRTKIGECPKCGATIKFKKGVAGNSGKVILVRIPQPQQQTRASTG